MSAVAEKAVIEQLQAARALESALTQTLMAHIAMTPSGQRYRNTLERHLKETKQHSRQISERLEELGEGRNILRAGVGMAEVLIGQLIASAKAPLDLLRGARGEEKLLANARDEFVSEALEIATYIALEEAARAAQDDTTARLAASILKEEEHMSESLRREIPTLTKAVIAAREGHSSYDVSKTGAAQAVRSIAEETTDYARGAMQATSSKISDTAQDAERRGRGAARQARKVPGVARAEGEVKGALAAEEDLAIANYDQLNVGEIDERLPKLSQIELAKIDGFERKNKDRATVLNRIAVLQRDEPWPGYDELTVGEIETVMAQSNDESLERAVREYERAHKNRVGVLEVLDAAPVSG
ncbi:MAG: DUF892 family protein [Solirubrobacteraceae bacterium]